MREFSKVSTSIWRSKKFAQLKGGCRLFYLYLLTCPHANAAGCFVLPPGYVTADLGLLDLDIGKGIDTLSRAGLITYDKTENLVLVTNWFAFNAPQNPKHAQKVFGEIVQLPESPLKLAVYQAFIACLKTLDWDVKPYPIERVSKAYAKGITTRLDETETRLDRDKTILSVPEKSDTPTPPKAPAPKTKPKRKPGTYDAKFEAGWAEYPTTPTMSKKKAGEAWDKAVASGVDEDELFESVKAYARYIEAENVRRKGDVLVCHMATFLNERRFEGFIIEAQKANMAQKQVNEIAANIQGPAKIVFNAVGAATYAAWFNGSRVDQLEPHSFVIWLESKFKADYVQREYSVKIEAAFAQVTGFKVHVSFQVKPE